MPRPFGLRIVVLVPLACSVAALARAQCPQWSDAFGRAGVDFEVDALLQFDDGSGPALYVGGEFVHAGTVLADGIARWDGANWSALDGGVEGQVHALAIFDDGAGPELYAGGTITEASGAAVNHVVKWNGSTWSPLSTGVEVAGVPPVRAMIAYDGGSGSELYVAGTFDVAGGQPALGIAAWDGAAWHALGATGLKLASGQPGEAVALEVFDDGSGSALYVGGLFATADGLPANNIARWNGASWSAVGASLSGTVRSLEVFDDGVTSSLFASGNFGVARWNGVSWSTLTTTEIRSLTLHDDGFGATIYGFPHSSPTSQRQLVRWNGSGWTNVGPPLLYSVGYYPYDPQALALTEFDDGTSTRLVAGGFFDLAGTTPLSNVATLDGASWHAFGSTQGVNHTVEALAVSDTSFEPQPALYVGGSLTTAGSQITERIARWDGSTWSALGPGLNEKVHALAFFDDGGGTDLYAAGDFHGTSTQIGGPFGKIARWDGTSWSQLGVAGANLTVLALATWDDGNGPALYAGGIFTNISGVAANRIAKWNGTAWSNLGAGVSTSPVQPRVEAIASFDDGSGDALYVAGAFQAAGAVTASRIARWNGSIWSTVGTSGLDAPALALVVFDDGSGPALYAGGQFQSADGTPALRVARWNGTAWSNVGDGFDEAVNALTVFDDGSGSGPQLYATGIFTASGSTPLEHIAKWNGTSWIALEERALARGNALAVFDEPGGGWPALYVGTDYDGLARYGDPCIGGGTSYCTAGITTNGCTANMSSSGYASRTQSSGFVVTVDDLEGLKSGTIFFGISGPFSAPWGNGTSVRCVAPPVARTGVQSGVGASGTCDGVYTLDFNTWMQSHRGIAPSAGTAVYMQTWFRDPGNGSNQDTSLSDALQFVVTP